MGWLFLAGLALLAFVHRRRIDSGPLAALACAGIMLSLSVDVRADSLCGNYTLPGDSSRFYEGNDAEQDRAGYASCWYAGLGLGYSYVAPEKEAQNWLLDKNKDNDTGFHLFIGRQITPNWFAEFKYADLGEAGITNRNPAIAAAFPNAAITYKVPSIMAGYQWRPDKNWKPFAKIGVSAINNSAKGGPIPFEEQTAVQIAFGAGLKYDFGRSPWSLRGDIDWYDRDAWYLGISIARFFGGRPNDSAPVVAAAAAAVAIEPEPDLDSDADGVLDNDDQCPDTPVGQAVDSLGCAVSTDDDDDGVENDYDECPDTTAGAPVDVRGCEVVGEIQLPDVRFETNSDVLRPGSETVLDDAAETLLRNPQLQVEVAGHTDSRGNAEYNRGLSERRAKTVRDYLIGRGVDENRLSWRGYGEEQAIADNETAAGREENRRVVLRIL
jgi:outer membrane protein OmpA-like peptidoglycan-associated protein/opacity protein-like surface antigen